MGIIEMIKEKIENNALTGDDLPSVLDAIVAIVKNNEDTRELLQDMAEEGEDVLIRFDIGNDSQHCIAIEGGDIMHLEKTSKVPTVTIITDKETAVDIISGKVDPAAAYSASKLSFSGNLGKAMSLVLILNVVGDELGLELKR
ncbi:MAG: SCP2 sterol-binding domain-containing protein [Promethearchaeota archaeon]